MTYYFTFGDDENFPYQDGWIEVEAGDLEQAIAVYEIFHPSKTGFINCARYYTERDFKATSMYANGNFGAKCHERIGLKMEKV